MSRKLLLIGGLVAAVVLNGAVLGTLYFAGIIWQPTKEELESQRLAEEAAAKEAADAAKYAHLQPLPEFKSRVGYVASMGEAIEICEQTLHEKEKARKSWAINHIESRYLAGSELYMVFLDYQTIVPAGEEPKVMKVTCEVEEPTRVVSNWKAMKAE